MSWHQNKGTPTPFKSSGLRKGVPSQASLSAIMFSSMSLAPLCQTFQSSRCEMSYNQTLFLFSRKQNPRSYRWYSYQCKYSINSRPQLLPGKHNSNPDVSAIHITWPLLTFLRSPLHLLIWNDSAYFNITPAYLLIKKLCKSLSKTNTQYKSNLVYWRVVLWF